MTKFVVILGFVIWFAAGLVTGLYLKRETNVVVTNPNPTTNKTDRRFPGPDRGPVGFLERFLDLNAEQKQQMAKIWSEVARRKPWEQEEKRRQFRKEKDDAIAALVRPEDYGKFDQILKTYADRLAALEQEERAAFAKAEEQTKAILRPEQREKYENFLKQHAGDRRGGPGGGGRDGGRDRGPDKEHSRRPAADTRPTTRPSAGAPTN
jgi:Spy/CpxP family protein refolding chaperone